jgi:hypothetical protein
MSSKRPTGPKKNRGSEDRPLALDHDTLSIQQIASTEWQTTATRVIYSLIKDLLEANPPPSSHMDPKSATDYFNKLRSATESEAKKIVQPYSGAQWLWYLRRLPKIFDGELLNSGPYDRQLADLISGASERELGITSGRSISFPVTDGVVRRILRLCATTILLSGIHTDLRLAGKGIEFECDGMNFPSSIPNAKIDEAVRLFDQRVIEDTSDFGVAGTRVFSPIGRTAAATGGSPVLLVETVNDWHQLPTLIGPLRDGHEVMTMGRYTPTLMSVSDLPSILARARGGDDQWWEPALPALLALLKAAWWALYEASDNGWLSLVRYGYLTEHWQALQQTLESSLPMLRDEIEDMFPGACPANAAEAIELLLTVRPQFWPPMPGPVLRPAGEGVFVDLQAATARLYRMMAVAPSGGKISNVRARHFEDVVQDLIDASPWAPGPSLRSMQRRQLRRTSGTIMTDLDAVGEFDNTLLIVDCKSIPYSIEYDAGYHTAVLNVQKEILGNKLPNWRRVVNELTAVPIGPNYDFSRFGRIVGLICTPHVFFVPLGEATQTIFISPNSPALRAVSSYGELKRFLERWPGAPSRR